MMRVWLAALFVFCGMLLAIILLGDWLDRSPILCGLVMSVIFLVLCVVAFILFNWLEFRKEMSKVRKREAEYEKQMREWEAQGLLEVTNYRFRRAFRVEPDEEIGEEEGPHYFLELDNGSVLYLFGHYLHELEVSLDGPEAFNDDHAPYDADWIAGLELTADEAADELDAQNVRAGHFSSVISFFELTVKRHRIVDRIVQVICARTPILDTVPSTFWNNPCCQNRVFHDGDIITDCTYHQLLTGV